MELAKRLSIATVLFALLIMTLVPLAYAVNSEDLTSVTVTNRDGRVVTVGKEPGTDTWSALADGQNFTIYTGLAPNQYGMWYCVAGRVKFDYTGFVEFQGDQWYVEKGKVATDFSGQKSDSQHVYTIDRGKLITQSYTEEYSRKLEEAEAKKRKDAWDGALLTAAFVLALVLWGRWKSKRRQLEIARQEALAQERKEVKRKYKEAQKEKERERKRAIAEEVYEDEVEEEGLSYVKADILTPREKEFYPHLKAVADDLGLTVSMKPRLGDLVSGAHYKYSSEGAKELFKVQRKHVDFALFDPDTLETKLIIELDDTTHDRQDRVNRDVFVDHVLEGTGYKILHVYNANYLGELILEKLNEVREESE